jgi:uncharacterized repeat protein (TIGR01451 family)
VKDPDELGLTGFTIELRDVNGQSVAIMLTEDVDLDGDGVINAATEAGIYEFAGLVGGNYTLSLEVSDGWTPTSASTGQVSLAGTSSGESAAGRVLGATCPAGMVCPNPNPNPNPPPTELCGDGVDNDGDGLSDEGCGQPPPPPTETCGDGIDNDGDGLTDEGCGQPPPPPVETCGDGIDNDGDGLSDEGCGQPPPPPTETCGDGIDNDGDGLTDEGCGQPPPPPPSADVWITKDDSPDPVFRGNLLTYTITVGNGGPDTATGIKVTDKLPNQVIYESAVVSSAGAQWSCTTDGAVVGRTVTCFIGVLNPGSIRTITILVRPYVAGVISNTATVTSDTPDPDTTNNSDTEETTVLECLVNSVSINPIWRPLGNNPHPLYPGGLSIEPDKDSPTDTVPPELRDIVSVVVQITPAEAGGSVVLRSFDVDDPHPSATYPDIDASEAGYDNRGTPKRGSFTASGTEWGGGLTVDGGWLLRTFRVTMQPGDNFRIAASCDRSELEQLKDDVLPGTAGRVPPFNAAVEGMNFSGKLTDMLTVWRRLHLEVDSMTRVVGNTVTGKLKEYVPRTQTSTQVTIKTDVSLNDSANRFENGTLIDKNGRSWPVISSGTAGGKLTVTVRKPAPNQKPPLGTFRLRDDDALIDGQDVPEPDISTVNPAMKYAYVRALRDIDAYNTRPEAPFILNMPSRLNSHNRDAQRWDTASLNANDFWVAYVLGAFQPVRESDNDPDSENELWGETPGDGTGGSLIYLETCRDAALENGWNVQAAIQDTVVHEVGHAVANSNEEPVTGWDAKYRDNIRPRGSNFTPPDASRYVERYLHLIRSSIKPAGR